MQSDDAFISTYAFAFNTAVCHPRRQFVINLTVRLVFSCVFIILSELVQ